MKSSTCPICRSGITVNANLTFACKTCGISRQIVFTKLNTHRVTGGETEILVDSNLPNSAVPALLNETAE